MTVCKVFSARSNNFIPLDNSELISEISAVKTTKYFDAIRHRSDRRVIRDEWIEYVVNNPMREELQRDGRIRRWASIADMDNRYLRVILLSDGETVHNAFFDRGFEP